MHWFNSLTLSRQFLVASFPVLLVGMVIIGLWVEREIERAIVTRIAEVQSLYVDSLVAPHLSEPLDHDSLNPKQKAALDLLFAGTPLGRKIVAFIVWRPDGRVLYSNDTTLLGKQVTVGTGLRIALNGAVYANVIDRQGEHHAYATPDWPARLIETYAPIHAATRSEIVGASEFYLTTDELDEAMHLARLRSWGVVAATTLAMYVLLFGLVRRGSRTIVAQREELRARVADLSALVHTNADLASKVRRAAARTTAMNEGFLRRVAADLHDGPAQDLGFAQMRLRSVSEAAAQTEPNAVQVAHSDLASVRTALDLAMTDLRSICAGMQLPDLEALSASETAGRVVRDFERKTGGKVNLLCVGNAANVALPVRITLFRVLQELLANGFRHAGGVQQEVLLRETAEEIALTVSDRGRGIDVTAAASREQGGLAGIRERVQALGGTFEISSTPGEGTAFHVRLPAQVAETADD